MKTIFIPGMKTKSEHIKYLETLLPRTNVVNYKSKGIFNDYMRLLLNYMQYETEMQKRVLSQLKSANDKGEFRVIAHSHGALILYDVLQKHKFKNLKIIRAIGPAKMIPDMFKKNVLNIFIKNDWILDTYEKKVRDLKVGSLHNIFRRKKPYSILILPVQTDKRAINHHKNGKKTNFKCSTDKKHAHKIQCYVNSMKNLIFT